MPAADPGGSFEELVSRSVTRGHTCRIIIDSWTAPEGYEFVTPPVSDSGEFTVDSNVTQWFSFGLQPKPKAPAQVPVRFVLQAGLPAELDQVTIAGSYICAPPGYTPPSNGGLTLVPNRQEPDGIIRETFSVTSDSQGTAIVDVGSMPVGATCGIRINKNVQVIGSAPSPLPAGYNWVDGVPSLVAKDISVDQGQQDHRVELGEIAKHHLTASLAVDKQRVYAGNPLKITATVSNDSRVVYPYNVKKLVRKQEYLVLHEFVFPEGFVFNGKDRSTWSCEPIDAGGVCPESLSAVKDRPNVWRAYVYGGDRKGELLLPAGGGVKFTFNGVAGSSGIGKLSEVSYVVTAQTRQQPLDSTYGRHPYYANGVYDATAGFTILGDVKAPPLPYTGGVASDMIYIIGGVVVLTGVVYAGFVTRSRRRGAAPELAGGV